MKSTDDELEQLLKPLKHFEPSELQMQRWQRAVKKELKPREKPSWNWQMILPLIAASFIGFVLGVALFYERSSVKPENKLADSATYERSYANLD